MPELLVFARSLAVGFVGAEIWRVAFYLGTNLAKLLTSVPFWGQACAVLAGVLLCIVYSAKRGAQLVAARMARSFRFDLLIAIGIGVWMNILVSSKLAKVHASIQAADAHFSAAVLTLLCLILASPLFRQIRFGPAKPAPQLYFIGDEEIKDESDDLLGNKMQAKSFAEAVLASGAHVGLVFGVDGPWGVGKTSFINLAQRYWEKASDKLIVCRFEPLRYASEPDLADRLIRDLSAAIQREVYAPEFRPAVSRYSRLIKGKADFSFLGFKLSLEPAQETIDELLDDIDEVLRRIGRRVVIVIDDLDRLDAKTTNNVLFATRRAFKLSQATYVLCYDTEVLVGSNDESSRAREFLEKFVTVKLSLFVDSSSIRDFLRGDWQNADKQFGLIPSDTMLKLGAVIDELANMLDGDLAAKYLPIVGDLRKVKRFVNAMLLMQLEKSNLGRTDFDKRDLINLVLLSLNYPGLFRRIYAEETQGRSGIFSVRRHHGESGFKNTDEFSKLIEGYKGTEGFLLGQLFDASTLDLGDANAVDEAVLASRACFNRDGFRNLEDYLKLIVRFVTPEPQETYVLYQTAVEQAKKGESIASLLSSSEFLLEDGERSHDQFWRVLVNQAHGFTEMTAHDAIDTLVAYLPRYSSISSSDRGLRQRSIYSLLRLLDRAGWGRTTGQRLNNTPENIVEIAWRIFGEDAYQGKGLLYSLAAKDRGVLGWNDLMLFRLQCCQDRQGQQHNLYSALIFDQDRNAERSGLVNGLTLFAMRKISQRIFALFKEMYIDPKLNFYSEVDSTVVKDFFGDASDQFEKSDAGNSESEGGATSVAHLVSSMRTVVKSFVIYQLSNRLPPTGSGVGCGLYDENGNSDAGGIAKLMNAYVFGVCFNPTISGDNVLHFLDHCLTHLSRSFYTDREVDGFFATKSELVGGFDPVEMGLYWRRYRTFVREYATRFQDREVRTPNYIAYYRNDLDGVFDVLDEMADATTVAQNKAFEALNDPSDHEIDAAGENHD